MSVLRLDNIPQLGRIFEIRLNLIGWVLIRYGHLVVQRSFRTYWIRCGRYAFAQMRHAAAEPAPRQANLMDVPIIRPWMRYRRPVRSTSNRDNFR